MRIVTIDDVLEHLNMQDDDSHVAELVGFVDAAEEIVTNLVGDVGATAYSEWYDGGRPTLQLRHPPVVSVTSVTEYRGNVAYALTQVATPAAATAMSYMWEPSGRLTRVNGATAESVLFLSSQGLFATFPIGPNSVQVAYQAGRAAIPAAVRLEVLQIVQDSYQPSQQGGHPGFADQGLAVAGRKGMFVMPGIEDRLAACRRPPSVA